MTYAGWSAYRLDRKDAATAKRATDSLLAAIRLDEQNDRAHYFLGRIYEDQGRKAEAIECWKTALRINASNFEARTALRRLS